MAHHRKLLILAAFVTLLLLLWLFIAEQEFLSFAYLKTHHQKLLRLVADHYLRAVAIFVLLYLTTCLAVPGALALTIAGGALFGTIPAAVFVNIGATLGSVAAFYATRFLLSGWIQERYRKELARFNEELAHRGYSYLLTLRIIPILPAFLVNYLAGLTRVNAVTFTWTTSVGVLPGSLIYAYAGSRLARINSPEEILSWPIVAALAAMGVFTLLPVLIKHGKRFL